MFVSCIFFFFFLLLLNISICILLLHKCDFYGLLVTVARNTTSLAHRRQMRRNQSKQNGTQLTQRMKGSLSKTTQYCQLVLSLSMKETHPKLHRVEERRDYMRRRRTKLRRELMKKERKKRWRGRRSRERKVKVES